MKSDWSIAGWLLCPIPEVHNDMAENAQGAHYEAAEQVLRKLFHNLTEGEWRKKCDKFRMEHREFRNKVGKFSSQNKMWEAQTLVDGNAHLWHDCYSVGITEVLGWFACRVTSKILGIGNAERCWGGVKQIKDGKRKHLGSNSTKKQSTIFVKTSIDEAKIKKTYKKRNLKNIIEWDDADIEFVRGNKLPECFVRDTDKHKPCFRCWEEDWEKR